jgi:hypothetical protein
MAQKTVTTLLCDLSHRGETEASETISFGFYGDRYEIDTCGEHGTKLRNTLGEYVAVARKVGTSAGSQRQRPSRWKRDGRSADVRAWCKANGHPVSDRGRIPQKSIAAYEAAHQPGAPAVPAVQFSAGTDNGVGKPAAKRARAGAVA